MRSAEQRWPALWKAEARMSRTACSGSAVESTIMALSPPVSAISMASGAAVSAKLPLDQLGDFGRAGEADAGDARIGGQRRADRRAVAGQQLDDVFRHAGLTQQLDGADGDQRRLLGRLGDHRIAGDERCRDLAGEDRERKIPRRDADDDAARLGAGLGAWPPRPRSSAGSRPPRALRRRRRPAILPASRVASAKNSTALAS